MTEFFQKFIFLLLNIVLFVILKLAFDIVFIRYFENFRKNHPYIYGLILCILSFLIILLLNRIFLGHIPQNFYYLFIIFVVIDLTGRKNKGSVAKL